MNRTEPRNQRSAAGWVSARSAASTSRCGDQALPVGLDQAHAAQAATGEIGLAAMSAAS
jgi:hypothetical protein